MKANELQVKRIDDGLIGRGWIKTLKVNLIFDLEPNPEANANERAPTHLIFIRSEDDNVKVGVAYENNTKRGEHAGGSMFSMNFTDPDLPEWMGNGVPAYAMSNDNSRPLRIEATRQRREA